MHLLGEPDEIRQFFKGNEFGEEEAIRIRSPSSESHHERRATPRACWIDQCTQIEPAELLEFDRLRTWLRGLLAVRAEPFVDSRRLLDELSEESSPAPLLLASSCVFIHVTSLQHSAERLTIQSAGLRFPKTSLSARCLIVLLGAGAVVALIGWSAEES